MTPYPQVPGVVHSAPCWGNASYHSGQAKLTKPFEGGPEGVVAHTFSNLISDGCGNAWTSALWHNYYCRRCERSLSPNDQRSRLIASYTYELPFGSGWCGPVNLILGNWQINGIATLTSGLPIRFSVPGDTSHSFGGRQGPDSTGTDARLEHKNFDPTTSKWSDTTQVTIPKPFTLGNLGRVHPTIRADFVEWFDFSEFKNIQIGQDHHPIPR